MGAGSGTDWYKKAYEKHVSIGDNPNVTDTKPEVKQSKTPAELERMWKLIQDSCR